MTSPNDFVMPYDKHKGKTLAEILYEDQAYVEWLAVNMVPRTDNGREIKSMATAVLANGKQPPPKATNGQKSSKASSTAATAADEQTPARPRIYSEITRSVILHMWRMRSTSAKCAYSCSPTSEDRVHPPPPPTTWTSKTPVCWPPIW